MSSEVIIWLLCTEYVVDSIWMFVIRLSGFQDAESLDLRHSCCGDERTSVSLSVWMVTWWFLTSTHALCQLIHTGTHCKEAHTWIAARKPEIYKSFKGRHLAAASLLSFTYPSILSSLLPFLTFENGQTSAGAAAAAQSQKSPKLDAFKPLMCGNNPELTREYLWCTLLSSTNGFFCV